MNDFTKEELIYLFEAIDSDIECFNEPEIAYTSRDKLKSMIDNYCEHDWENICCQCSMDNVYCHKCEKRFTDE